MCSRRCCRLPEERYATAEQVTAFLQPLLARVKALPGVVHAAASTAMPPYNAGGESTMEIAGTGAGQHVANRVSAGDRGILPGSAARVQGGQALQRSGRQRCAEGRRGERDVRAHVPAQRRSTRAARALRLARDTLETRCRSCPRRLVRDCRRGRRRDQPWTAGADRAGSAGYRRRSRDRWRKC